MNSITESGRECTAKESASDLSSYSFHMADQGTDSNEREKQFKYAERDSRFLYHIEEALERIKNGAYGMCETCGKPIGRVRLEAIPHARLCITCKSNEESSKTVNNNVGWSDRLKPQYSYNEDFDID